MKDQGTKYSHLAHSASWEDESVGFHSEASLGSFKAGVKHFTLKLAPSSELKQQRPKDAASGHLILSVSQLLSTSQ